jgi:hypothetical protein
VYQSEFDERVEPAAERAAAGGSRTTGAPLSATLGRLCASGIGGGDLARQPGVPDRPGWVTAAELASDRDLLDRLLGRVGRAYGTEDRAVTGTLFLRDYLWRILAPVVGALLIERRLPRLGSGDVALRFDAGGSAFGLAFVNAGFAALAADPDAGHPDASVLPSEGDLLAWLRDQLADAHLPNLLEALRDLRIRRGMRALWGVSVDACADAFLYVGRDLGREDEARALAERLLAGPAPLSGPTNFFVLEHDGGSEPTRTRDVCCLYYKIGDRACFTCPRTTNEERLRLLAGEEV